MPAGLLLGGCFAPQAPADVYADPTSYDPVKGATDASTDVALPVLDAEWPDDLNDADGGLAPDAALPPPNPDCDFSGHWMVTERMVSTGLGIQQASTWWMYYELEQSGDAVRVRRGLACGTGSQREGALGVEVDMRGSWQAIREKNELDGITAAARTDAGGCALQWNRIYRVLGATVTFYQDPAQPLPQLDEPAEGDQPGWEDWDADGQPGISVHINGALSGTRYMTTRLWTRYAGTVAKNARSFRIPMDWNQNDSVLGATSDALKTSSSKDADASLHFAQFDALPDDVLSDDDAELCARLRERAPNLGPNGD